MWIVAGVVLVAFIGLFLFRNSGIVAKTDTVSLADIPRVYKALQSTGNDGSFAAFIPPKAGPDDEDHLNVQFSIENGAIGFDWVLLSPINIRDKDDFVRYLDSKRIPYRELEANDVSYIRVEDGRAATICQSALKEMYGVTGRIGVEMIVEGFEWVPSDA